MTETPPRRRVRWAKSHRLIRSAYPPIELFEDIADPADWALLAAAEAKTNPRVLDQIGKIRLVPPERRVSGPGASYVMSPFVHCSPARPTRFSDGAYGVYYAGNRFEVALAETVFHFEAFMARTAEPAASADFRELVGPIDARLHDIRHAHPHDIRHDQAFAPALDPDSYGAGQALGRRLRDAAASNGIVYPSVRYPKGQAVALFWPDVPAVPIQARHLCYRWTGERVDAYLVYGEADWRPTP